MRFLLLNHKKYGLLRPWQWLAHELHVGTDTDNSTSMSRLVCDISQVRPLPDEALSWCLSDAPKLTGCSQAGCQRCTAKVLLGNNGKTGSCIKAAAMFD